MSTGLKKTFQFLAKAENDASVDVLIAGLDCPNRGTLHGALEALLERRAPQGHREVFRRLSKFDAKCREIISERPTRLIEAIGEALQNPGPKACKSACDAIVAFRLYDALEALVSVLVDPEAPHTTLVAQTILKLTQAYYAELSGAEDLPSRKNQDALRQRITTCLESATRKFHRHEQIEPVEAYLLITKCKNATFRSLLQRPDEACYRPIIESLTNSPQGGVVRLLLSFLGDPQMPMAVVQVICRRCDAKFVKHLAEAVGPRPMKAVTKSLARFDSIAWAKPGHELFKQLDNTGQEGAIRLLMASSVDRSKVLEVLGYLLMDGKPGGRRAAAKALAQFEGSQADSMALNAVSDPDAGVRAEIIKQLRPRQIPAAFSLLIHMVDSPEPAIRQALSEAMPEFTVLHFLRNFDSMPDALQSVTGHLVRKIDMEAAARLTVEMESPSPVRRRRAALATRAMGLVDELEEIVIRLLSDEDHMVRVAAAKGLADCETMPTWEALRDAMFDRSVVVQEAAEHSMERISQSLQQQIEEEAAGGEGAEEEPQQEEIAP